MKMHSLAGALLLSIALTSLTGCGQGSPKSGDTRTASSSQVLEVDSLLRHADQLAGQTVLLEGVCTHICKHGGGKIFLLGSDDTQTIRIDAGEKVGKFKPETVNSVVRVTGEVCEERIDEAFLDQWESELKAAGMEHGEGGAGCESDQQARGEAPVNSLQQRIDNFRARIAERQQSEGKNYLSFYSLTADSYEIVE